MECWEVPEVEKENLELIESIQEILLETKERVELGILVVKEDKNELEKEEARRIEVEKAAIHY